MQLIIKYNKGVKILLWIIDIYNKYAWVVIPKVQKNASQSPTRFRNFWLNLVVNQIRYG